MLTPDAEPRMNPYPAYLHEQLEEKLKERRVVVWYDPNREFAPFVESLIGEVDGHGLKQVMLGALKTGLSVFQGNRGQCAFTFIFVLRDFVWRD